MQTAMFTLRDMAMLPVMMMISFWRGSLKQVVWFGLSDMGLSVMMEVLASSLNPAHQAPYILVERLLVLRAAKKMVLF